MKSIVSVERGICNNRRLYISHGNMRAKRFGVEVFDSRTAQRVMEKILALRMKAIQKQIMRKFIG